MMSFAALLLLDSSLVVPSVASMLTAPGSIVLLRRMGSHLW